MVGHRETGMRERANGSVTVSDPLVGKKTSRMWRKSSAQYGLGHQKGKARRNPREMELGERI